MKCLMLVSRQGNSRVSVEIRTLTTKLIDLDYQCRNARENFLQNEIIAEKNGSIVVEHIAKV